MAEVPPFGAQPQPEAPPQWVTQVLNWGCGSSSSSSSSSSSRGGSSRGSNTPVPTAYRAPQTMRLADRDDHIFEPVLVPIGPFHRNKIPAMAEHKIRILSSLLDRLLVTDPRREEFLIKLCNAVKTVEEKAKGFYSEPFPNIDFVEMMVLDGCYLLEIFRIHARLGTSLGDDPIFMGRWMLPALALDIVKLENQLPYFVLCILYDIIKLPQDPTLKDVALSFLTLLCPGLDRDDRPHNRPTIETDRSQSHLLSLFHSTFTVNRRNRRSHCICIDDQENRVEENRLNSFPSVTDLCLSGIKAVKKKQMRNLLEIEYKNGKLEIPTLKIDHSTKILMRNLVAYEQCNKTVEDNFTSYVTFMDALVNSAEDVEVLRVAGVINHFMNDNEDVSVLLNNLTANLEYNMNEGYLAGLNAQIYRAHHSAFPQFRARFKRLVQSREGIVYIVTIFALYLTVLQTVFTVLSYFLPK